MTDFFDKRNVTSVSSTPNANCRVLDHRESPGELGLILGNRLGDDAALAVVGNAIDANKHDAAVVKSPPKNEFPEILVFGDENSGIPRRSVEDDVVRRALHLLGHPQSLSDRHDTELLTVVLHEPHFRDGDFAVQPLRLVLTDGSSPVFKKT